MPAVPAERISRFLSYLLRHQPKEYPLSFDPQGFVSWGAVMSRLQERFPDVTEDEVRNVVLSAEKKRFEIRNDKIRATYGHSFPVDLGKEAEEPPAELFLGTARDLAQTILRDGLTPRDRQYVHLSDSMDDAVAVGQRRDPAPVIVVVDAQSAHAEGVRFYRSGPLFLAAHIPPKFLSLRH
jgi:putative RNA 2'-phosphotransferase